MNIRFKASILALLAAGLPLGAQTNFATLVTDGAWTWYNDPRAIIHNGRLYFGYVRASDSKTALSVFDLATGQTTNLWAAGFTQWDDHNNPGLLAKQDGTLLALYSRHGSDQYFSYRTSTSTNPAAPADWAGELSIAASGASMTYANPFQLRNEGGKIYDFCRNLNYNPTVYTSTNGGISWSSPQAFIATGSGSTRPYVKYSSDYTQRIDFLYTDGHPRDVANSLYHLYYLSNAFHQTDGTLVKDYSGLPLQHDSGERGSILYQYSDAPTDDPNDHIPTGRAWCWEIALQSNGAPVCVFTVQRDLVTGTNSGTDDRIFYYYARWTGSAWQKRFIAHAGRPLYVAEDDYAGGICIDPIEPHVVYLSSNAQNPFNLTDTTNVTLRTNSRYELWRGITSDGGLTFSWTQLTTNSTADNLRPYVPRRNGGERCLLWFRGSYSSYTSYACSVVGLFTSQMPSPPAPQSLVSYTDASSGSGGNTTLANGSIFSPPLNGTTGADNNWEQRTGYASSGNVFESGGEASEDAPELKTRISGLIPGGNYSVYAFFWDATGSTEHWCIRAGFLSAPGANPLYSASDAAAVLGATPALLASSLSYSTAPTLFAEGNRVLLAASLGLATADANGQIQVFVDDKPTTSGANNRTWYDGLGHARLVATNPPSLAALTAGRHLTLSWPANHTGWRLLKQTNRLATGLSTNLSDWGTVADSSVTNRVDVTVDPAEASEFYRLFYP